VATPVGSDRATRTLVVDDDPDQRALVRRLFAQADLGPVAEAGDAEEALVVAAEHRPDLIVLDLSMPGRSGLEVLPELSELLPDAAIVILSNFPRRRTEAAARRRGAVGYVEKRVPPDRLVAEILVAAAITSAAEDMAADLELPAAPSSPRRARAWVRDLLSADDGALVSSVELLVSELVTNAVVHAESAPRIEIHLGRDAVRVAVLDDDPALPRQRAPDEARPGGRGLRLVESISDRWGAERSDGGKVVWFEIDRSP
jgi:DNA-binding NarL/FixJ family response regulator